MERIKLTTDTIRYIALFETLTGAVTKDCITENNSILFIVKEGNAGLAIGKNGINIQKLQSTLNKKIEVLEYSDNIIKFIQNMFRPAKIEDIYTSEKSDGRKVVYINPVTDKGLVKNKFKKAKALLQKYFGINELVISGK